MLKLNGGKSGGYTLIEVMIVVLGLMAVFAVVYGSTDNNISFGFMGTTEVRCIAGYQHVVGQGGQARQVLSEDGKGIRCQ